MTYFNKDEIFLAYKKVKHFFYYDNANLLEKKKISNFENELFFSNEEIPSHNVKEVKAILFERVSGFINDYFENNLVSEKILKERIGLIKLPKSLIKQNLDIITNKANINENLKIERFSYFADMPIELHIISVLWILYSGRYLNSCISGSSYANCLDMEFLNNKNEPSSNFKLFKPYFVQYQTWRDTAITKAEALLNEGRDVTILSLDIKNYYHSVRINLLSTFKQIEKQISRVESNNSELEIERVKKINDWLLKIHKLYKEKCITFFGEIFDNQIPDPNEYNLPVGLISSGLLANYYLKELDERIINNINPAFYGRYVDDLMFVFSDINNFVDKDLNSSIITFLNKNFVKKDILDFEVKNEYIKDTYFKNGDYLDLKESILENDRLKKQKENLDFDENKTNVFLTDNIKFKIKTFDKRNHKDIYEKNDDLFNYDELTIQSSKVVLHYLDHKESRAIINIFKRKLDNQRSEFRFLPDEDEISEKFDEEAFELRYNDSINKFRSISDFSENKYGASKFLAKKIFAKSFGDKEIDDDSDNQILTFFKGEIAIKFYSLWEKVATYFIVSNREEYLFKFIKNVEKAIHHTDFSFRSFSESRKNSEEERKLLFDYLEVSVAIPLALNPNFVSYHLFNESDQLFFKNIRKLSLGIRKSNLIRHSLMSIPSCNLTNILCTNLSLLENDFNKYKNESKAINIFEINKSFAFLVPYYVQFHDVNILRIIQVITSLDNITIKKSDEFDYLYPPKKDAKGKIVKKIKDKEIDIINSIPDDSFKLYYFINYSWKFNVKIVDFERTKKRYFTIDKLEQHTKSSQSIYVNVTGDKVDNGYSDQVNKNIAIANIKINSADMFGSITGHANVKKNRRKNIFGLINEADKNEADLLVFPEVSIPYSWIRLLAERSHKRFMGIVAGLEHWVNSKGVVFNFMVTILPFKINYYTTSIIKLRLKNHYSHFEKHQIKGYRLLIPNENLDNYTMSYDLFHWRKTYFSVYNCFELADINHRSLFKSKVDFIIASEYNKDTSYFADIAGAWVRDIHSYFIQVNSSDFGDSRIIQPSKSFCKDLIQVKGGNNSTILVGNLDIQKLRNFQYKEYHLQKDDIDGGKTVLKPTPPDFDRKNVKIRIENKDFNI